MARNDTIVFFNRRRVFRIEVTSFGAATCTGSAAQAGGAAQFIPFGNGAIGQLTLTANVAAGTVVFPPWAFFVGEIKGTPFRDDDWQVGDELTLTLEVPWRCTYGAVARDVVSSTTKTSRVTAIEFDGIGEPRRPARWTSTPPSERSRLASPMPSPSTSCGSSAADRARGVGRSLQTTIPPAT